MRLVSTASLDASTCAKTIKKVILLEGSLQPNVRRSLKRAAHYLEVDHFTHALPRVATASDVGVNLLAKNLLVLSAQDPGVDAGIHTGTQRGARIF